MTSHLRLRGFGLSGRFDSRFFRSAAILPAMAICLVFASALEAQQPGGYGSPYGGQYPQQAPPQGGYGSPAYGSPDYANPAQTDPGADYGVDPGQGYGPQAPAVPVQPQAPLNVEQLEQLVAPIALYPDTLVAQVLAAATYPAQVVDADHWRQAQGNAPAEQIVYGANAQNWDPSLKALTAFPQVLGEMDQNIRWTIALGNAYYNQPQDVLDVIQVMRQRAQAAGNLASGPQETVGYDQGYIQVAPANPEVVYLPAYDPWTAYGEPIQPYRGFSFFGALGSFFNSGFGSGLVRFGAGIATSAFRGSPFGLLSWGLDWLTHNLLLNHANYYSRSTSVADWGLPHGGPRYFHPGVERGYDRGRETARLPGNEAGYRPQGAYGRPEAANGYRPAGGGYGQSMMRPAPNGFAGRVNAPNGYPRPPMEAYNRTPNAFAGQPVARPQVNSFVRSAAPYSYVPNGAGNGAGRGGFGASGYGARPAAPYQAPRQAYGGYRGASPGTARGPEFSSGRGFEGGKAPRAESYRGSGGGHEFKAPKAPKPPKMEKMPGGGGHGGGLFGGHGGGHHR